MESRPSARANANEAASVDVASDPAAKLDHLLSKELLELSVNDRNNLQEEIHGVRCLASEETPDLIEESLRRLAIELDEGVPISQKRGYLRSQETVASRAYINGRDFRLMILRCELFDPRKAAERMARICNSLLDLFGEYALERPIKLSDFTNAELKVFRKGRVQLLPFRDRSGRKIAVLFPGAEFLKEKGNNNRARVRALQLKIFLYCSMAISSDVDTQRKGLVFIVWFDAKLESGASPDVTRIRMGLKSHHMATLRASAVHICSPNTPFYKIQRSLLLLGLGPYRSRLRIHLGESMELRYHLNGYGISTDTIPLSWTGTVKVGYLKQWMRIRQYIEGPEFFNSNRNETSRSIVLPPIECPRLNDVLCKKGKSAKNHPGNAHFRSLVQSKIEEERYGHIGDTPKKNMGLTKLKMVSFSESLIEVFFNEVKAGNLRVLLWSERLSWWVVVTNEKQVRKKIGKTIVRILENAFRNLPPSPPRHLQETRVTGLGQTPQPCLQGLTSICISSSEVVTGIKRKRSLAHNIFNDNCLVLDTSEAVEQTPGVKQCSGTES